LRQINVSWGLSKYSNHSNHAGNGKGSGGTESEVSSGSEDRSSRARVSTGNVCWGSVDASSDSVVIIIDIDTSSFDENVVFVSIFVFVLKDFALVSSASVPWIGTTVSSKADSSWKVHNLDARSVFSWETVGKFSALLSPSLESLGSGSFLDDFNETFVTGGTGKVWAVHVFGPVVVKSSSGWSGENLVLSVDGNGERSEGYEFL